MRGPWGQAEEQRMGAMEGAGAGVWPGLVAEPRRLAWRKGYWLEQLSSSPLSFEACPEVV